MRSDDEVAEVAEFFDPEAVVERLFGARGEFGPPIIPPPQARELAQEPNPEDLNFDRVTLARSGGWIVRIHPGEMRRTPNESRFGIDANAVRCAMEIPIGDFFEDAENRARAIGIDRLFVDVSPGGSSEFFADDAIPK